MTKLALGLLTALFATALITSYTEAGATAWFINASWIVPPVLALAVGCLLDGRRSMATGLAASALLVAIRCASAVAYAFWELRAAVVTCESLIDDLEAYRTAQGASPPDLDQLDAGPLPWPPRFWFHRAGETCGYQPSARRTDEFWFSVGFAAGVCDSNVGGAVKYQRGRRVAGWYWDCDNGY